MVDALEGSRLANMAELRPLGGHLRVLFAFDRRQVAILLLGGRQERTMESVVRGSDCGGGRLYEEHLAQLREEGELTD